MDKADKFWSETVDEKVKYHPPEGTFTRKASEVVDILLKGADGDAGLALKRLVFYINRAGSILTNGEELEQAKHKLEELERSQAAPP